MCLCSSPQAQETILPARVANADPACSGDGSACWSRQGWAGFGHSLDVPPPTWMQGSLTWHLWLVRERRQHPVPAPVGLGHRTPFPYWPEETLSRISLRVGRGPSFRIRREGRDTSPFEQDEGRGGWRVCAARSPTQGGAPALCCPLRPARPGPGWKPAGREVLSPRGQRAGTLPSMFWFHP